MPWRVIFIGIGILSAIPISCSCVYISHRKQLADVHFIDLYEPACDESGSDAPSPPPPDQLRRSWFGVTAAMSPPPQGICRDGFRALGDPTSADHERRLG